MLAGRRGGGAVRLPAPTLILPSSASRGVWGATRGTRREWQDTLVGLAVDPAGDRAARVSGFRRGYVGGGCAAAGPDVDLAGFCVARGLGRDTGDATRMAGRDRRPRSRSRCRPRSAGFGVSAGLRGGGLRACRPRSGHRRLPRRVGARRGGHDAKGRSRPLASRSIPPATAQRGFRGFGGVTWGGLRGCRPRH